MIIKRHTAKAVCLFYFCSFFHVDKNLTVWYKYIILLYKGERYYGKNHWQPYQIHSGQRRTC